MARTGNQVLVTTGSVLFSADYRITFTLVADPASGAWTRDGFADGAPLKGIEIVVSDADARIWIVGVNDRLPFSVAVGVNDPVLDKVCIPEIVRAGRTIQRFASVNSAGIAHVYARAQTSGETTKISWAPLAV